MLGDGEIEQMQEEIDLLEAQLKERRQHLHKVRYAKLREAVQARKDAEEEVIAELTKLGIKSFRGGWGFP
jgi:NADH:ubiquinone oxidoreductase subunit F (NADH-binding)